MSAIKKRMELRGDKRSEVPDLNEGRTMHGPSEDNIRPILCDFKADFAVPGRARSAEKYEKS